MTGFIRTCGFYIKPRTHVTILTRNFAKKGEVYPPRQVLEKDVPFTPPMGTHMLGVVTDTETQQSVVGYIFTTNVHPGLVAQEGNTLKDLPNTIKKINPNAEQKVVGLSAPIPCTTKGQPIELSPRNKTAFDEIVKDDFEK